MIKQIRILLHFEWLAFKAEKGLLLFALLLIAAGLYGIYSGNTHIMREEHKLTKLDTLYQANIDEMKAKYPINPDAGNIGYYHAAFAKNQPSNWSKLALGQRDIHAPYLKIRLLAVQNQLYTSENYNPFRLSVGIFDLSFVFVFLLPLFIIAICFNMISEERESGTLAMVLSLPIKLSTLILSKFTFRFCLVFLIISSLSITGWLWAGVTLDAHVVIWFTAVVLYAIFWFALSFCIISLRKNSAFNAIAMLGSWLLFVIVIPAVATTMSEISTPVDEGLKLSLEQREEVHAGWDRPREQTMERFFLRYPAYRDTSNVEGDFKWKWYFAFQELGDASVEPIFNRYLSNLHKRETLASQLNMFSPAAKLQEILNGIATTNLSAQIDFIKATKAYHGQLKDFYYPYLFKNKSFNHADFKNEPQLNFKAEVNNRQLYMALSTLCCSILIVGAIGVMVLLSGKYVMEDK